MEFVLTESSAVSCDHPPTGGGAITLLSSQTVLSVEGSLVLTGSLAGATFEEGCQQTNSNAGEVMCASVIAQSEGPANVLKVNGQPVLLVTSEGTSNGKPDDVWSAKDAEQSLLRSD
jgi:hypothetical protein